MKEQILNPPDTDLGQGCAQLRTDTEESVDPIRRIKLCCGRTCRRHVSLID
jgi:hypothetical protein